MCKAVVRFCWEKIFYHLVFKFKVYNEVKKNLLFLYFVVLYIFPTFYAINSQEPETLKEKMHLHQCDPSQQMYGNKLFFFNFFNKHYQETTVT